MMVNNSWITFVQKIVKRVNFLDNNIELFLFGSALTQYNPRDIDLLMVYDIDSISIEKVINIRKKLTKILQEKMLRPVDICALSNHEVKTNSFIKDEKAVKILG